MHLCEKIRLIYRIYYFELGDMFYLCLCKRTNLKVSGDIYKFYAGQKKNT